MHALAGIVEHDLTRLTPEIQSLQDGRCRYRSPLQIGAFVGSGYAPGYAPCERIRSCAEREHRPVVREGRRRDLAWEDFAHKAGQVFRVRIRQRHDLGLGHGSCEHPPMLARTRP